MGEGEFYDLSYDEAACLLARAKDDFAKLDVPAPHGFIAPAWLLGTDAAKAVGKAGFEYTTFLTGLQELVRGSYAAGRNYVRSQSLVYSCRNHWRRTCSLLWNSALRNFLRGSPLLRLSLHPPDCGHPAIWRQILALAREEATRREVTTYRDFVVARHPFFHRAP